MPWPGYTALYENCVAATGAWSDLMIFNLSVIWQTSVEESNISQVEIINISYIDIDGSALYEDNQP